MEVVQSSVLGRLLLPVWLWLRARYEYSLLAKVLRGIAQAWSRACAGSVLIQFVTREGCLSKAWKDSGLCRILTFLLSIPTILLQKLYGACRRPLRTVWPPGSCSRWWRKPPWRWPG